MRTPRTRACTWATSGSASPPPSTSTTSCRACAGPPPAENPMRRRCGAAAGAVLLLALLAGGVRGQERDVRLAFLGDSGTGKSDQRAVRDQMLRFPLAMAFMLGDNIYDRGSKEEFGRRYDDIYRPL